MKIYLVGGAVRDTLLNYPFDERDWVVVGASPEQMIELGYKPVGKDFPVFLHPENSEEYALARTERKTAPGYKGFVFHTAPDVTLEEDLIRRDLTINAMAMDEDRTVIDPYGGQRDLESRTLRHVSPAFAEDPLRVLRVARFAARYHHLGFTLAPETAELMAQLSASGELNHLTAERVWQEVERGLMTDSPDVFITCLRDCGALKILLPEVDALWGVPQRADYHPEVDTGVHLLMSLQQAARLDNNSLVRFAVLMHDLGKGITPADVLPRHTGHEAAGVPLVQNVCDRLKVPREHRELALAVTQFHLLCHQANILRPKTLLKLLQNIGALRDSKKLDDFIAACLADARGRTGFENTDYPACELLPRILQAVMAVDTSDLANSNLDGKARGEEVTKRRIAAIAEAVKTN